jgi:hypothetical protein
MVVRSYYRCAKYRRGQPELDRFVPQESLKTAVRVIEHGDYNMAVTVGSLTPSVTNRGTADQNFVDFIRRSQDNSLSSNNTIENLRKKFGSSTTVDTAPALADNIESVDTATESVDTTTKEDCDCPTSEEPTVPAPHVEFRNDEFVNTEGTLCGVEAKDGVADDCGYPGVIHIDNKPASGLNVVEKATVANAANIRQNADGTYSIANISGEKGEILFKFDANDNLSYIKTGFNENIVQVTSVTFIKDTGQFLIGTTQGNTNYFVGPESSGLFTQLKTSFKNNNIDIDGYKGETAA